MKKVTRMLAALAAVATMTVSASASYTVYDLKNEEYCSRIDSYYGILYGEDFLLGKSNQTDNVSHEKTPVYDIVTDGSEKFDDIVDENGNRWRLIDTPTSVCHHIYQRYDEAVTSWVDPGDDKTKTTSSCVFEFGNTNEYEAEHGKSRMFINGHIEWSKCYMPLGNNADDVTKALNDSGFDVTVNSTGNTTKDLEEYYITFPENVSIEDVISIYEVLRDNYNGSPAFVEVTNGSQTYTDEKSEDTTDIPTTQESEQTVSDEVIINGDVNGDGEVTLRDAVIIARKMANYQGGELPDNADYNQDGKVNIKDAARILEDLQEKYPDNEELKSLKILKGDADFNGEVGLSDLVAVSKYNVNNAVFPFTNELAFINADMNDDDLVDGLDTQALVEYNLGKK